MAHQGPEARVRQRLAKGLREQGALAQPIESGMTGVGIPDMYVAHYGLLAWVELKADVEGLWPCARAVHFRGGQRHWGAENEKHGGKSFVGIQYANGFLLTRVGDLDRATRHPVAEKSLFQKRMDCKTILAWMKGEEV